MKTLPPLIVTLLLVALLSGCAGARAEDLADRVVIVVNERDAESVEIGRYYADQRGIPRENIVRIDAPAAETISRQEYLDTVLNSLERQLIELGWIEGMFSALKDAEGRSRSAIGGHRLAYLVLCRGVPLRIRHDPSRLTPEMEKNIRKEFLTNAASVDSELALMMVRLPITGFIQNPLFGNQAPNPVELNALVKVARLDGPTAADAMALVDQAIRGERAGLRGRAYVDLTGPHADGDTWLKSTAEQIRSMGFDLDLHEPGGMFPISSRFDAPALYFGWYANDVGGPFLLPDFRFPPGAIALHIHSFSARTVRSASEGWVGPMVARGVTATLGNVYEPYLALSHRPDMFLERLGEGETVGDAAAYSIPAFGWQGVLVGDPLYRPFAASDETPPSGAGETERDAFSGYAVGRQMNLLRAAGREEEALKKGREELKNHPDLGLALTLAKMQIAAREPGAAIRTLGIAESLAPFSQMNVAVAKELADTLSTLGEHKEAFTIYRSLLGGGGYPGGTAQSTPEGRRTIGRTHGGGDARPRMARGTGEAVTRERPFAPEEASIRGGNVSTRGSGRGPRLRIIGGEEV